MKNAVYYSIKGSEEKPSGVNDKIKAIARSIAAGANTSSYPIGKHTLVSDVNILFVGCDVGINGKLSRSVRGVLKELSPNEVKLVVLFTVSKSDETSSLPEAKSILAPLNVPVYNEEYICLKSSGGKRKGAPPEDELQKAKQFAADIAKKHKTVIC